MEQMNHIPVLIKEVIENLNIKKNGYYIDMTAGLGGHSQKIHDNLSETGKLVLIDKDIEMLNYCKNKFNSFKNIIFVHSDHSEIKKIGEEYQLENQVDGILADLGVSSYHLDNASRGFSFRADDDLDMRLNTSQKLTAAEIVNTYSEKDLADIIYYYGEDKHSRRIASNIVQFRRNQQITTTKELAGIVLKSYPKTNKRKKTHPATKTFQAIRIVVNDELVKLKETILSAAKLLKSGGRIIVISFHSLEDRIVKRTFKELKKMNYKIITKKPIIPTEEEVMENPRSRSSKMRVLERIS